MNEQLQQFARETLKEGLAKLPEDNQKMFKRMYSPENLEADINEVVDNVPVDRLDWAMQQVARTVQEHAAENK